MIAMSLAAPKYRRIQERDDIEKIYKRCPDSVRKVSFINTMVGSWNSLSRCVIE